MLRQLLIVAALALTATPVRADRDPTPVERAQIESALRSAGFTAWDDIEFEDDGSVWEIDDAIGSDGKKYDLHLRTGTLEIVMRDVD